MQQFLVRTTFKLVEYSRFFDEKPVEWWIDSNILNRIYFY